MKRVWKVIIVAVLIVAMVTAFAACTDGKDGLSAYEIAIKNGTFQGTEAEWLESLKQGESAYDIAVKNGTFQGTEAEWIASLQGKDGTDGTDGKDAAYTISDVYEAYKEAYKAEHDGAEYEGTFGEFLQTYFQQTYETVSTETMVAEAVLSCVSVYTNTSGGAGVIYKLDKEKGDAYIITNYHVVYDSSSNPTISDQIFVLLYGYERVYTTDDDGKTTYKYKIPATYVGGSMKLDIAVLYVENSELLRTSDARAVNVGDSTDISIGQDAIAIGNPEGYGFSVTSGVISVDSETLTMKAADEKTPVNFRVIRIDTSINSGNSGGGLFDAYGRLVGIVNAKMNSSAAENIAYAIPVNIAAYTANSLIEKYEANDKVGQIAATKCMLGITITASDSRSYYDTTAKRVRIEEEVEIVEDLAPTAAAYGQLQKGDIITSIKVGDNEKLKVTRTFVLVDSMLLAREGDTIVVEYKRGDETGVATITVNSTKEIDKI